LKISKITSSLVQYYMYAENGLVVRYDRLDRIFTC